MGSWDGLTYQEIATRSPGVFDGDGRFEWYFRSPDGERYDAFAGRLAEWLQDWIGRGVLLVVTHGIVTRVLRGLYAGLPRAVALTFRYGRTGFTVWRAGSSKSSAPRRSDGPRRNASCRSR